MNNLIEAKRDVVAEAWNFKKGVEWQQAGHKVFLLQWLINGYFSC